MRKSNPFTYLIALAVLFCSRQSLAQQLIEPSPNDDAVMCSAYNAASEVSGNYQETAPLLFAYMSPLTCAGTNQEVSHEFNFEDADLPKTITKTKKYCSYGHCITVKIRIYVYRCGASICSRVLGMWRKCGPFCWQEYEVPDYLDYPWEIYPQIDGWDCAEISDNDGEEIRTCVSEDGDICITQDWVTNCFDEFGDPIPVPDSLPDLFPGYGEPPLGRVLEQSETISTN